MAEVLVRPASDGDLPGILAIYNEAVLTTTASYDEEPSTLEDRRAWLDGRRRQGLPVLVAEHGGLVVGFGALGPFRPWAGYRHTVEDSVYVDAAHRGRGVGPRIVAPLVERARELGMHAVLAGIDAENEASIRLHARLGFAEVARLREVGRKFGRWLDLVFMELLLDR